MDNKQIVTCHGDQTLFSKLKDFITRGLPRESVEWKRSYGRASQVIKLEVNFVPFNPNILPLPDEWTLAGRPFFHTFWTDCDADTYKSTVREEIIDWLSALKEKECSDWLIVCIVSEDVRVRSKLLRNSVYNKVKSDFCGKNPDRVIMLTEPLRSDAKSSESWSAVFYRTRLLMLDAYNRSLDRFEEHMRSERERRTERNWSFCRYFLLQEELAFFYEMLRLHEDALVQYDELDALFTQFVVNHAAGERANWLVEFAEHPTTRWDGLCLTQPINFAKRSMIKRNVASLLDLRNYLFSRQVTLRLQLSRVVEIGNSALPFMHNCIRELAILEVTMPVGAVDCWVFLSCLEVLRLLDSKVGEAEEFTLQKATLRDYARSKIARLGSLCGLMPGSSPTSDQLHLVVELLTGLVRTEGDYEAMNKLKQAVSSKDAFYNYYVEMCESTMAEFKLKHVGRTRMARAIGRDLAAFYMAQGKPHKAEGFLRESLNLYKTDGWEMLADETRMMLAECQRITNQTHKYCKTCMHLASSLTLAPELRLKYQQQLINVTTGDVPSLLRCSPIIFITDITTTSKIFVIGRTASVRLTLTSNLLDPVPVDRVSVSVSSLVPVSPRGEEKRGDKRLLQRQASWSSNYSNRSRKESGQSVMGIDLYNKICDTIQMTSQVVDLHQLIEYSDPTSPHPSLVATICRSPLRISPGAPPGVSRDKELARDPLDLSLSTGVCVINPGENQIVISSTLPHIGVYRLGQLCIKIGSMELIQNLSSQSCHVCVVKNQPSFSIQPKSADSEILMAGIPQIVSLTARSLRLLEAGTNRFLLSPSTGLNLKSLALDNNNILTFPAATQLEDDDDEDQVTIDLEVFAAAESESDNNIKHQLTLTSEDLSDLITLEIEFSLPWQVTHALHTSYLRKYVQVALCGWSQERIKFSRVRLECDESSAYNVEILSYNTTCDNVCIGKDDTVSYLWEIKNLNLAPQQCDKSLAHDTNKKTPQITSSDFDKSITAETEIEDSSVTVKNQDGTNNDANKDNKGVLTEQSVVSESLNAQLNDFEGQNTPPDDSVKNVDTADASNYTKLEEIEKENIVVKSGDIEKCIRLKFMADYELNDNGVQSFSYSFSIQDFEFQPIVKHDQSIINSTRYVAACKVLPDEKVQNFLTNSWYKLSVVMKRVEELCDDTALYYEICVDKKIWKIRGVTSDMVEWNEGRFETEALVSPLVDGFISIPSVKLLHRTATPDADCKSTNDHTFDLANVSDTSNVKSRDPTLDTSSSNINKLDTISDHSRDGTSSQENTTTLQRSASQRSQSISTNSVASSISSTNDDQANRIQSKDSQSDNSCDSRTKRQISTQSNQTYVEGGSLGSKVSDKLEERQGGFREVGVGQLYVTSMAQQIKVLRFDMIDIVEPEKIVYM